MAEAAVAIFLAVVIALAILWWTQRSLMYFPSGGPVPPAGQAIGGDEDVEHVTRDGLRLRAWFVLGRGAPPRPAVLIANGNAEDRSDRAPLGSGVVTALAVERPPVALILRSPFTSFAEVGSHRYPWLPVAQFIRDRYPIDEQIPSVRAPLLIIAGAADEIVPLRFSQAVHEKAAEPKRLVVIDGVGHNDPELLAGERIMTAITQFLGESAS